MEISQNSSFHRTIPNVSLTGDPVLVFVSDPTYDSDLTSQDHYICLSPPHKFCSGLFRFLFSVISFSHTFVNSLFSRTIPLIFYSDFFVFLWCSYKTCSFPLFLSQKGSHSTFISVTTSGLLGTCFSTDTLSCLLSVQVPHRSLPFVPDWV